MTRTKQKRALLVGAFRSIVPEGRDGLFGSQGGFVDTLAPSPYSLANGKLKAFAEADHEVVRRWTIELLNLSEPLELEDEREEVELGEEEIDVILEREPEVVAFSAYCWNIDAVLGAAIELKARRPGLRIVIGGRGVEGTPEALLAESPAVDAFVIGEGERSFLEILKRDHESLDGIPGVIWRSGDEIRSGGEPWCVATLDHIPSPYLTGALEPALHGVMLELTRGCQNACGYCTWSAEKQLRWFGSRRIEDEVRWIRERGHRHVTLTDAAINYDTVRLAESVDAIRRADPDGEVKFTYNLRHELLDAEQLEILSRFPTHMVLLGVESLWPEAFESVDRKPPVHAALAKRLRDLARVTRPPVVSIILGLPGDSEEGFKRTVETLLDWTRPNEAGEQAVGAVLVSLLQVYRGSKLWYRRHELSLRYQERGIPYLIEGPGWSESALARSKRLLMDRMSEDSEVLKAAEAIVMSEERGGVDPWLTRRRVASLLQGWPVGTEVEGWTFERLGLLRDTGQAVSLRFSWCHGGSVRLLLKRRTSPSRSSDETRLFAIDMRTISEPAPPEDASVRLRDMVKELLLTAEERVARVVSRRRVINVE